MAVQFVVECVSSLYRNSQVYQRLRIALFHTTELEGAKLSGEIELDESYFGGARKG